MSLPFFETLSHCFPQSRIDIIAKDTVSEVFRHHPAVHTIHTFSKSRVKGLRGLFAYGRTLRKRYGPYDIFITLPTSFSSAMIGYGVGSPIRLGFTGEGRGLFLTHKASQPHGIHRAHIYRSLLTCLNKHRNAGNLGMHAVLRDHELSTFAFPFSEAEQQIHLLEKQAHCTYIVFSVNSEAQSRRLPLEKWIALGNRLLHDSLRHVMLVFIGTSQEQSRVSDVIQGLDDPSRVINFAGNTTIRQLALLLRDADAVVANDSGPMHLANAVGVPVVTFFGAGDPIETGPFNPAHSIVINKHLPCSPCVKNSCRFPAVYCLEQITIDEVYENLMTLLKLHPR